MITMIEKEDKDIILATPDTLQDSSIKKDPKRRELNRAHINNN